MTTDYSFSILLRQRHEELAAEVAANRLARLAARSTGRTPWWRRLTLGRLLRPSRARRLTAHHVVR